MNRDMDLARAILLKIEGDAKMVGHGWSDLSIEGRSTAEVSYHVMLLSQAGLIEAKNNSNMDCQSWQPKCLTWESHEFLDAARNEGRWQKAKKLVAEKAGNLGFELLRAVLTKEATDAVFGT